MADRSMTHQFAGIVPTHPMMRGHFPGNPLVPGSVLLAQVLECLRSQGDRRAGALEVISAKFLTPLRPGTAVTIELTPRGATAMSFAVRTDSATIAVGKVKEDCSGSPAS